MLKESPSPALRSCAALAQAYHPLARDLFHAAFVSCWQEISEQYQESLVRALQMAFRSNTIPAEILQDLLNLGMLCMHYCMHLYLYYCVLSVVTYQLWKRMTINAHFNSFNIFLNESQLILYYICSRVHGA